MNFIESITLKQQAMPNETLIKDRGQVLEFYSDHLILRSAGDWDIPNEEGEILPRLKVFFDNTLLIEKRNPLRMEMYYYNKAEKYVLNLDGGKLVFGDDGEHPSIAKEKCQKIFDKIIKWKYDS